MLYLIPTPIGNLKDITLRALETLEIVDVLLCEDTRVTRSLLEKLGIKNQPKLVSYYKEVESQKLTEVVGYFHEKLKVGLVSDAGTPLLSDPGWLLAKTCIKMGIKIEALPGTNALLPALQLSGMPADKFVFLGFLPKKNADKYKIINSYPGITKLAYESPERLVETISSMEEGTEISICREITKLHEETIRGKKQIVLDLLAQLDPRGEVVIVWR